MAVDFDTFLQWAKDRFGEENIKTRNSAHGIEILTHSFYAHRKQIEDYTFNLWMNPSGGKSKHPEKGSFRCWKTDTMGSLVHLVADWDSIPYEDAEELLCGTTTLRALELKVNEFFGTVDPVVEEIVEPEPPKTLQLPEFCGQIDKMSVNNRLANQAIDYLKSRKLPTTNMYVCSSGDYKNRIIIPYYNWYGDLIWYNSRLMMDKEGVIKYMKCKSFNGVTQDDILFMTSWPVAGTKIYLVEGEFDAITLSLAGFVGCAIGGKFISDTQIEMIRRYQPVLAFDADEGFKKDSGLQALINVGKSLLEKGVSKLSYVRPPKAYKDWNKLYIERNIETVKAYVERFEKPFTSVTPTVLLSNNI